MTGHKHALVTGAASGLGNALAKNLLRQGFKVTAIDRDSSALEQFSDDQSVDRVTLDLSNIDDVEVWLQRATQADVRFDRVFLNAGISATGRFETIPTSAHQSVITVNALAPMVMAAGLARLDRFAPRSECVMISSLSHAVGYPGAASYAASKDAIAAYAKSIRKPFGKMGINIMCVFPGPIRTDHAERHAPKGANAEKRMAPDELAARILKASSAGKAVLYPGAAAKVASIAAAIAPSRMTRMMKHIIFDKLDRDVY